MFKFHGHYEYKAALRYNALIGRQDGPNYVEFANGQKIKFHYPMIRINGLLFGGRVLEWYDSFTFEDASN